MENTVQGPEFYDNQEYRKKGADKIEKDILQLLIRDGKLSEAQSNEVESRLGAGKNIKEILAEIIALSDEDFLDALMSIYRRGRVSLPEIVDKFGIDSEDFLRELAKKFKFTYVELGESDINYKVAARASSSQLRACGAIPYKEDEINVFVAFKNPFDLDAQDRIGNIFNRKLLKIAVCDPAIIDKFMLKIELNESVTGLVDEIRKELSNASAQNDNTSGILKLIELILKTSISNRASDIHIEPTEKNCIVRARIDGMLTEAFVFEKDIYPPLVSRIKMLSQMDIAERRKPQDGRFSVDIMGKKYDFRISTLPIMNGESLVMRVLDKSKVVISLSDLGMHPENFAKFTSNLKAPYGIMLVTGPTGSGKTTTLYAALNDIKSIAKKIITVEDPVEYQMGMIQQVQVSEKAGLTFASALRSILRQDPDIIMIGEIRDQETLRIAIQAALTGHLVFSTLHTNDAISAITRMVDMGIESYLVSGALIGVEAQRLVRRLCPHCKQKIALPEAAKRDIEKYLPEDYQFYKAVGCDECSQTGYVGREMISEILPISDRIASLIARDASKDEIEKVAYEEGFIDMFHDGILRAARGVTTIEEIYRVTKV